ncbi:MAG: diguanylate cyclase [Deltaproteobacteria bacterium]|nr:diguanylate cyclase [Deltaproteobacteria bacterium]
MDGEPQGQGLKIEVQGDTRDDETTEILDIANLESDRLKAAAHLTVLAGPRVGEMIKIDGEIVIGRGPDVDFRIVGKGISREHLRLVSGAKGVMAEDLDSSNGSFVNGKGISEQLLVDGDKIQLGEASILKFSYADEVDESFQQRMYAAAIRDPLTTLHNRQHLREHLESELAFANRHETPLCVIMMDLDHFKAVNDTHGHGVGDAVLVGFSEFLKDAIRNEDFAARYGGEEFVLVCRGIRGKVGLAVAARLLKDLGERSLVPERPEVRVTMSAGVAAIPDGRYATPEAILDAADGALYAAKDVGRNCVRGV